MKIKVIHENGAHDEIHVIPPATIKDGAVLDSITCASGYEYYFTKNGYYDGAGGMVAGLVEEGKEG